MIIVGNGRVGGGLYRRAKDRSVPVQMVSRSEGRALLGEDSSMPVLVCTNADDLAALISDIPPQRRAALIFIQNGMIDPVLVATKCSGCTRGLIYFAAPARGASIQPGAKSVFTGPHAQRVVDWFQTIDLEAGVVSRDAFSAEMASKLIWNCTFGLLCDVYDMSVGGLVEQRRDEVDQLIGELCMVAMRGIACSLDASQVSDDLCAYSLQIPDYQGAVKQWEWRNGWFVETAASLGLATPIHSGLLARHSLG